MTETNQKTTDNETEVQFALQRIYVKDISFEAPSSPQIFQTEFKPQVKLDIDSHSQNLAENIFEVVLHITVQVFNGDEKTTAFLTEVQQAGIFTIIGLNEQQREHTLNTFCLNILFPYARECIDNLVVRGSFPALMLAPINFDALYAQKLEQKTTTSV